MSLTTLASQAFKLWWLQAILMIAEVGFASFLALLFFRESVPLYHLFFAQAAGALFVTIYLVMRRVFFSRGDIRLGFLLSMVGFSFLFLPFSIGVYYAYMIFSYVSIMTFFTPYNILFFERTPKERRLRDMTMYFAIFVVVGIVAPLVGAELFEWLGLKPFLSIAIACYGLGFFLAGFVKKERYPFSIPALFSCLKRVRTITLLDGMISKIFGIIPLYALLYITSTRDFGAFLSIISLVALFFSFRIAKQSDATQNRVRFLYPLSVMMGCLVVLFGFVNSFWPFFVITLFFKGLDVILAPIRSNIMQDAVPHAPVNWVAREVFLNIGRSIVMAIMGCGFLFGVEQTVFLFLGILPILFPLLVFRKKVYAPAY